MSSITIEPRGKNVYGITLVDPTYNEEIVKQLPEVRNWIAKKIKGNPYFESFSSKYWYLVDKDPTDNDDIDYLKEIYLELFIGKELPDANESFWTKGYLDIRNDLTPSDKSQFEKHIKDGDEMELISKDPKEKVRVSITNIEIITVRPNERYEVKYTLSRV